MKSQNRFAEYTITYKDQCRARWYSGGRPSEPARIRKLLEPDEYGRTPHKSMIQKWKREYGWDTWADVLDERAMVKVENTLVEQKSNMLQEQAKRGLELQQMGMQYLGEEGFDSASAAVQAVVRGAELERTSRGIGEMIVKMSKMSDVDLKDEIMKRLQQASDSGQIIDVDPIPENNDDTESTED